MWCRVCGTDLMGNALQTRQREVRLVPVLPVILLELVQVGSQQLAHKEEVLLKAVVITQAKARVIVC